MFTLSCPLCVRVMPWYQIREIQQIEIERTRCNPLYPTVLLHYNCNIISSSPIGSTFLKTNVQKDHTFLPRNTRKKIIEKSLVETQHLADPVF